MNANDGLVSAGDIVKRLIGVISPSPTSLSFSVLISAWEELAGKEISKHVIPKDIVKEKLILDSDHPGWTQRLKLEERELLVKINTRFPDLKINGIRVYYAAKVEQ